MLKKYKLVSVSLLAMVVMSGCSVKNKNFVVTPPSKSISGGYEIGLKERINPKEMRKTISLIAKKSNWLVTEFGDSSLIISKYDGNKRGSAVVKFFNQRIEIVKESSNDSKWYDSEIEALEESIEKVLNSH